MRASVGSLVGISVGVKVGTLVGALVGDGVGCGVGIGTHFVRPVTEPSVHCPGAHSSHSWYSVAFWYLPDGQCKQVVELVPAANWPAAQFLHEPPVLSWNRPTSQSVHSVAGAVA